MTVLFTAIFSSLSIVWDREFGFMREMLVAPVRHGSLVLGKCLAGTTIATIQGSIMLIFAGLVHVPYSPLLFLIMIGEMALAAFTLTAFGILIASRMQQMETFQAVMQFFVLPMFFLSGAVFPLSGLPAWLQVLTRVDPLTYAVDPMRRAIFSSVSAPAAIQRAMNPGVSWGSWHLPVGVELAVVAALGLAALGVAIMEFSKPE